MAEAKASPAVAALAEATAGASSAVFTALALHPLEVVKTRIQTGRSQPPVARAVREIFKLEGLCALYRGVGAQCCEEALENFVFFYLYDACLKAVRLRCQVTTGLNLAVGYVAGVGTTTFVLPVEILSTQLQLSRDGEGFAAVFRRVLRGEGGLAGLFRGYWLNLILCANPAIQNTCFDTLKGLLLRRKAGLGSRRRAALSPLEALLLGALSKALALSACYPLVRLKVAIQAGREAGADEAEAGERGRLVRRLAQLYRGLGAALAKNVVSAALLYMLKDQIAHAVKAAFKLSSKAAQRRALTR